MSNWSNVTIAIFKSFHRITLLILIYEFSTKCRKMKCNEVKIRFSMNQANVTESYGPLLVTSNDKNLMKFGVDVSELQHRNGKLFKVVPVATWSTDMPETFVAKPNMTFVKIEPKIPLYRIVTVIVRRTTFLSTLSTFHLLPFSVVFWDYFPGWTVLIHTNHSWLSFDHNKLKSLQLVRNNDITSFPCSLHSSEISNHYHPKLYFGPKLGLNCNFAFLFSIFKSVISQNCKYLDKR